MNSPSDNATGEAVRRRSGPTQRSPKTMPSEVDARSLFDGLKAVDAEKIEGLFHVFSPDDFRNLMEMVHRCIVTETDRVEEAAAENNFSAAMIAAHKITGSSGNYAFIRVSKAAARVNDLLNNGNAAEDALKDLRREADLAIGDLETVLARLS